MADYRYSYNGPQEGIAKGVLKDGAVSTKVAIEMCNYLRGRNTKAAKAILERILKKEQALPFKRFTDGVGHRPGKHIAAGRYPEKASEAFLNLIKLVELNAQQKGLSEELVILHLAAHKASTPYHMGRQGRRKMKRTHVELVLKEDTRKPKVAQQKKSVGANDGAKKAPVEKAEALKTEKKPEVKIETPKVEVETKTPETKPVAEEKETVKGDA